MRGAGVCVIRAVLCAALVAHELLAQSVNKCQERGEITAERTLCCSGAAGVPQWDFFHGVRGFVLADENGASCRGYTDENSVSSAFRHDMMHSSGTMRFFVQISVDNPDMTVLRITVGNMVLTMNETHVATNTGDTAELGADQLKKKQMQELTFQITVDDTGGCNWYIPQLHLSQSPDLKYRCYPESFFFVHGTGAILHKVVLEKDKQRLALWDFTAASDDEDNTAAGVACRPCPSGTKINPDGTGDTCDACVTGLRVNVDAHSPWWYSESDDASGSIMVGQAMPHPEWAVLFSAGDELQSGGILRHSESKRDGNMALTDHNVVYAYDNVMGVCMESASKYEARVTQQVCDSDDRTTRIKEGKNIVLLASTAEGTHVRELLGWGTNTGWTRGDRVYFCPSPTAPDALCMNPVALYYDKSDTWSPANVQPLHQDATRYTIYAENGYDLPG